MRASSYFFAVLPGVLFGCGFSEAPQGTNGEASGGNDGSGASGASGGSGGWIDGPSGGAPSGGWIGDGGSPLEAPVEACFSYDGFGDFSRNTEDGRFEAEGIAGYGFAYISPVPGAPVVDCGAVGDGATAFCAAGSVAAHPEYAAMAGIGLNVNQAGGENTDLGVYPSTVASITVGYLQNASSTLRVQATTTAGNFCNRLENTANWKTLVPSDFNSRCWDDSGDPWDGTGLTSIQLVVPSSNISTTQFDACLTSLEISP